jgi:ubiquinone/menaquinone biosynthesis C-methylase UbiE
VIRCPDCAVRLDLSAPQTICPQCANRYSLRHGILDLLPGSDFYWGEVGREKMLEINRMAASMGWFTAIQDQLQDRPNLVTYICSPARLGWLFHCYDQDANKVCLDLGSGWGTLTFGLSRFYRTVYSVDGVLERLRFQSLRMAEDGVTNVRLIRGSLFKIPLDDHSVDLAVVNGLLEWVALSEPDLDAEEAQLRFLLEVRRVVKPAGRIYIGVENRFGLHYLLGSPDHSGLPFTSLLPRIVASQVVRFARRREKGSGGARHHLPNREPAYRTYTHSLNGYRQLLQRAGFPHTSAYWAWQSYSYPRASGTVDGISIRYLIGYFANLSRDRWLRPALALLHKMPPSILGRLVKAFAPHFLFVAAAAPTRDHSLEIAPQGRLQGASSVRLSLGDSAKLKTTFLALDSRALVAKAIRVSTSEESRPGRSTFVVKESPGIKGRLIRPSCSSDVRAAALWLAAAHMETAEDTFSPAELRKEIRALAQAAGETPPVAAAPELLPRFVKAYEEAIEGIFIPVVREHGDFTPPNILVNPSGALRLIDWEFSQSRGNPLLDAGAFGLSLLRRSTNNFSFSATTRSDAADLFFETYLAKIRHNLPLHLAPGYYLLRLVARRSEAKHAPALDYFDFASLGQLVGPALKFGLVRASRASALTPLER